jgi:hypothetical protein
MRYARISPRLTSFANRFTTRARELAALRPAQGTVPGRGSLSWGAAPSRTSAMKRYPGTQSSPQSGNSPPSDSRRIPDLLTALLIGEDSLDRESVHTRELREWVSEEPSSFGTFIRAIFLEQIRSI